MPSQTIDLGVKDADGVTAYPVLVIPVKPSNVDMHFSQTANLKIVATVRKVEVREDEKGAFYRAELELRTLDILNVS